MAGTRWGIGRPVVTTLLVAGFIASFAWGWSQYSARRQVEIQAENQYQRAFQQLSWHVNGIEERLAVALAAGSPETLRRAMADLWRLAYSAQQDLAQLPVATFQLNRTETFLARVGDIAFTVWESERSGLGGEQWEDLRRLYAQAEFVNREMQSLRASLFAERLPWTTVARLFLASAARPGEEAAEPVHPAAKALITIEDGMQRLPDPEFHGDLRPFERPVQPQSGPPISEAQALAIARRFLGPERLQDKEVRVAAESQGRLDVISVEVVPAKGLPAGPRVRLDVQRQGGQVVWMLDERSVPVATLPIARAVALGREFLDRHGFPAMEPVAHEVYQNRAVITYVFNQGGVLVYPDQIKLQVALDSGEVVGFEALGFLSFHKRRTLLLPRISEAEARARLNPRLEVEGHRLAVILDDRFQEALTHEFRARLGQDEFLVYIDARTGEEIKVVRVEPGEVEAQTG